MALFPQQSMPGQLSPMGMAPGDAQDPVISLAKQLQGVEPGQLMAAAAMLDQQKARALNDQVGLQVDRLATPRFGVLDGMTNQRINPGTGEIMEDATGQVLQSGAALNDQAAQVRAAKGFNVGEETPDQIQAKMMTGLAKSIEGLPEEDRHLAFERGIGVLMGKGVVQFGEVPAWDRGGKELAEHIAKMDSDTKLGVAEIGARGQIGASQNVAQGNIGAANIQAQGALSAAQTKAQADVTEAQLRYGQGGRGNPQLTKELAKTDAMTVKEAQESFDTAQSIKNNLQSITSSNPTASAGIIGRLGNTAVNTLGLSTDTGTANRQIEQASNTLALQMKSLYKMTGAMSDSDRAFLQNMVPKVSDTPEARTQAVGNISRYVDYVQSRSAALQDYIQTRGSSAGFNEAWAQANPGGPVAAVKGVAQPAPAESAQPGASMVPSLTPEMTKAIMDYRAKNIRG